jgi:hypothetical protein
MVPRINFVLQPPLQQRLSDIWSQNDQFGHNRAILVDGENYCSVFTVELLR